MVFLDDHLIRLLDSGQLVKHLLELVSLEEHMVNSLTGRNFGLRG